MMEKLQRVSPPAGDEGNEGALEGGVVASVSLGGKVRVGTGGTKVKKEGYYQREACEHGPVGVKP